MLVPLQTEDNNGGACCSSQQENSICTRPCHMQDISADMFATGIQEVQHQRQLLLHADIWLVSLMDLLRSLCSWKCQVSGMAASLKMYYYDAGTTKF